MTKLLKSTSLSMLSIALLPGCMTESATKTGGATALGLSALATSGSLRVEEETSSGAGDVGRNVSGSTAGKMGVGSKSGAGGVTAETAQYTIDIEHERDGDVYLIEEGKYFNVQVFPNTNHPDYNPNTTLVVPGQYAYYDDLGYPWADFGWSLALGLEQEDDFHTDGGSNAYIQPGQLVDYMTYLMNDDVKCEGLESINILVELASTVESLYDLSGSAEVITSGTHAGALMYKVLIIDDPEDCM